MKMSNNIQRVNAIDKNKFNATEEMLEELIPNENLRNIVNANGEFIVGENIYKISPLGTFYTNLKYQNELNKHDSTSIVNAPYIAENLKKIGNVYLYETYGENTLKSINNKASLNKNHTMPKFSAPNISTFPIKSSSRWTIVGGWRDKVFGEDKWHYEPIHNRRRIGANLYDYNYVVIKTAGFKAKVQHNQTWFKTWANVDSWHKELTIGWRDMVFEITIPGMENFKFPSHAISTTPNYSQYIPKIDFKNFPFSVSDGGITIIVPLVSFKKTFSYADLQEMIFLFTVGRLKAVMGNAQSKPAGFLVDIPSQNKRYIYIENSQKSAITHELTHNYQKEVFFEVFLGNQGGVWDYIIKSITASQNMKNFRLISGSAYAYTQNDNGEYKGMIVKKMEQ